MKSFAVAAQEHVGARLPRIESSPVPPSIVSFTTPAGKVDAVDAVVAAEGVDDERIVGAFGVGDVRP